MSNTPNSVTVVQTVENPMFIEREGGKVLPSHLSMRDIHPFVFVSIQQRICREVIDVMVVRLSGQANAPMIQVVDRFGRSLTIDYSNILDVVQTAAFDAKDGYHEIFPIASLIVESSSPNTLLAQLENPGDPCVLMRTQDGWRLIDIRRPGRDYPIPTEVACALQNDRPNNSLIGVMVEHSFGGEPAEIFTALVSSNSPHAAEKIVWPRIDFLANFMGKDPQRYISLSFETEEATLVLQDDNGGYRYWAIDRELAESLAKQKGFHRGYIFDQGRAPLDIVAAHEHLLFDNEVTVSKRHVAVAPAKPKKKLTAKPKIGKHSVGFVKPAKKAKKGKDQK